MMIPVLLYSGKGQKKSSIKQLNVVKKDRCLADTLNLCDSRQREYRITTNKLRENGIFLWFTHILHTNG